MAVIKDNVLIKVEEKDIDENGFYTVAESIDKIAPSAFENLDKLVGVNITKARIIGEHAFGRCKNLQFVNFENDSTQIICSDAFWGCNKIEKLKFPLSLEKIGERAFANCSNLSQIIITTYTKKIATQAFSNCNISSFVMVDIKDNDNAMNYKLNGELVKSFIPYLCSGKYSPKMVKRNSIAFSNINEEY